MRSIVLCYVFKFQIQKLPIPYILARSETLREFSIHQRFELYENTTDNLYIFNIIYRQTWLHGTRIKILFRIVYELQKKLVEIVNFMKHKKKKPVRLAENLYRYQ